MLGQRAGNPTAEPIQRLILQAGVDLLTGWAQRLHGLRSSRLSRRFGRAGTFGVASTQRWHSIDPISIGRRAALICMFDRLILSIAGIALAHVACGFYRTGNRGLLKR